jgi:MFS family permease
MVRGDGDQRVRNLLGRPRPDPGATENGTVTAEQSGTRPGLREVFAQPDYRRLWAARTVSQWGDTINFVALALLIYDLTGSGLGVTGVVVAEVLPVLLLAPVAGPLVDRRPRVRVMVGSDLFRVALMIVLAFWHDAPAGVYAIAFAMSVGAVFFNPAAGSVLPALVRKDALVAANSGIWTAAVLSQIVLAPLAGLLVTQLGYGPAFIINAVSYGLSALVLRGLRVAGPVPQVKRRRLLAEAREGVAVLLREPLLRALAVGQLLAALSAGATSALLVVLAEEHLGVTGRGYGLLIGAIGIGAALGPLVMLRLIRNPARPVFVFGPFGLRGLVDLVLATVTAVPVAAASLVAYGVGTSTGAVTFNSMLQAEAPEHVRGRVFASMDVLWQGGRLISLGLGGVLADLYGIQVVYYLGGACCSPPPRPDSWPFAATRLRSPTAPGGLTERRIVEEIGPNQQTIHTELDQAATTLRLLVAAASAGDLRRRTQSTLWTNQQMLFHMVFGYMIVLRLLPLVRFFGRRPARYSRAFSAVLNASTRPFHVINYLGSCGGAVVFHGPRLTRLCDHTLVALHCHLDRETDEALSRTMHFPVGWDPYFRDTMTLLDVYHYGTQHFDFHAHQLTLNGPAHGSN